MIAKCPTCEAKYKVADEKVSPGGTKFKCKKCKGTFMVYREVKQQRPQGSARRAPAMRNCPHCGKPVPAQAIKCRYCRETIGQAEEGAGFEAQEAYAPEGGEHSGEQAYGPASDHQDPFAPQGEQHAPQGGGFDPDDESVFGGSAGYGGGPPAATGAYAAQITVPGKRINPHLFAFPLWLGFFGIMVGAVLAGKKEGLGVLFALVGAVALIYGVIYGLVALYRCWAAIQGPDSRTTPGKAVGFLFIPLFNFYWIFVAVKGLAEDINAFIMRNGIREEKISVGLSLAYCILYIVGIIIGFASLAAFIIQTILVYQWARFNNSVVRPGL